MRRKSQRAEKSTQKQMNFLSSIRFKMLGSYVLMIGFIILVGFLAYRTGAEAIKGNYKTTALQSLDMMGEYVDFGFDNVKGAAVEYLTDEEIGKYLTGKMSASKADRTEYYNNKKSELTTKATADSFIKDIYFFSDGVASLSTNKKSTEDMYSKYMSGSQGESVAADSQKYYWLGQPSVIDETLEVDSSSYAIRLIKSFYRKDAFLAIDIEKDAILSILDEMNLGDGSQVAFVTADGTELRQDGSRENLFFNTAFYPVAVASKENAGIIENVKINDKEYLFLFRKLEDTGAMVCALIPNAEILKQVEKIQYIAAVIVVVACIIALLIGGGLSLSINRSIGYFINKLELVAGGNIGTRLKVKKKDEFQKLASHMNQMLDSVTELLLKAKDVSNEVSASVERVTDSSQVIAESTSHISMAMEEIEQGLTQQADDTIAGVDKLEGLAGQIGTVEQETQEIKNIADSTQLSISDSVSQMTELHSRAEETTQITGEVITNIESLNEKTKKIGSIIDTINSIADETALLSLNASIEAARAGEAGKGFSVVADSIKKLADQSMEATDEIRAIVEAINQETEQVVIIANRAESIIEQQAEAMSDTQTSFNSMSKEVELLLDKVNAIINNVAKMQDDKEVSVDKMQNISAVTEEVVASVSTVTNKTQQQVTIVNELQGLSEKLSEQADLLETSMKQFTIE